MCLHRGATREPELTVTSRCSVIFFFYGLSIYDAGLGLHSVSSHGRIEHVVYRIWYGSSHHFIFYGGIWPPQYIYCVIIRVHAVGDNDRLVSSFSRT